MVRVEKLGLKRITIDKDDLEKVFKDFISERVKALKEHSSMSHNELMKYELESPFKKGALKFFEYMIDYWGLKDEDEKV